MASFLYTLLIIFSVVLISFFLINIRHVFTGKEFRGTCSTNNPMLKDNLGSCTVCGSQSGEACQKPENGKAAMAGSIKEVTH